MRLRSIAVAGTVLLMTSGITAAVASVGGGAFAASPTVQATAATTRQVPSGANTTRGGVKQGPNVQQGPNLQQGPDVRGGASDGTEGHPAGHGHPKGR